MMPRKREKNYAKWQNQPVLDLRAWRTGNPALTFCIYPTPIHPANPATEDLAIILDMLSSVSVYAPGNGEQHNIELQWP